MKSTYSVGEVVRSTIETTGTTGLSKDKTTGTIDTTGQLVDAALLATADLISEQFKAWYAKQAYRLGPDRYLGLASDARQGRHPARLFSHLLKQTA